jgi:phenylacetate-CoA ligase
MSFRDTIYRHSPVWVQDAGISLYGLRWRRRRFGGAFEPALAGFIARERYTLAQWREFQTNELRRLLRWSFSTVPAYRGLWTEAGVETGDLDCFEIEDLSRLPLISKDDLRRDPDSFLSTSSRGRLHSYATSGSTGTPLTVRMSSRTHQLWSAAYEARCRVWAGVNRSMSRAMMGGRLVVPRANSGPPFWRYNAAERQLYFSAFHISAANAPAYAGALNRFRPDYLVGYASAHFFLARIFHEQALKVHSPKAVLTSSEKLTVEMREMLESVYRAPVFDAYSGVEPCCLASECEHHLMHISPDVGIVEIIGEDGLSVNAGEEGEVVATGFLNYDQPLIRYRMNDVARMSADGCPCGRNMTVIADLVGRLEDTVIAPDGRETVRFHGIFIGLPAIHSGQIIQESLDRFRVRLVAPGGLNEDSRAIIERRMRERLGRVTVLIEIVNAIELTERGKFRAVISHVPRTLARTPRSQSGA